MPISCSSKPGMKVSGADHDLDVLAGAAIERRAVDGALEGDRDPIAGFGLGALALGGIGAVLVGDALDGLVDVGVGHFGDRLLDGKALEIGERDRRHDLDRDGVGEIGFAGEDVLDLLLLRRHRDLGFGREAEAALGEDLRVGVADGLLDGLRHHRAAIDLLEVAHRHLARTEAVEADLVLEIDQTGVRLGIEIRCGNADLEFVLQSLGEGFCDLHGVNLLPAWSGLSGRTLSIWSARGLESLRRWFGGPISSGELPLRKQVLQQSSCKRCQRLVRAEGLEPPQLSSLEPKSSASTSSATPADSIMSGRDAAGGGLIT